MPFALSSSPWAASRWWSMDMAVTLTTWISSSIYNQTQSFGLLAQIGYQPRVPITADQFADPDVRRRLIDEKRMQVLSFWSDLHRDTPLDVFISEPFDFIKEYELAEVREISPGLCVRIVRLETLLKMKKQAGRLKDLADVDELSLLHGLPSSYD
jgi:hypothetical protein